jgi:hypothetical protein
VNTRDAKSLVDFFMSIDGLNSKQDLAEKAKTDDQIAKEEAALDEKIQKKEEASRRAAEQMQLALEDGVSMGSKRKQDDGDNKQDDEEEDEHDEDEEEDEEEDANARPNGPWKRLKASPIDGATTYLEKLDLNAPITKEENLLDEIRYLRDLGAMGANKDRAQAAYIEELSAVLVLNGIDVPPPPQVLVSCVEEEQALTQASQELDYEEAEQLEEYDSALNEQSQSVV